MSETSASPVSFAVNVARLPAKGMPVEIVADEAQRAELARIHGLLSVAGFRAKLDVTSWKKGGVRVSGRVTADIAQECIVTLEPVEQHMDEEVSALYLPEGSKLALPKRSPEGEILLDAEGEDAPEIFTGDTIDVGQLAEEYFALAIDPYPRKSGAALPRADEDDDEPRGPLFDKLQALKKKL